MELRKNLKLVISLTLICLFFVFLGVFAPSFINKIDAYAVLEGSGTLEDPYQITNLQDLETMQNDIKNGENSSAYYKLMQNINLENRERWNPIGKIGYTFSGYFDGNGKTISNVNIIYDKESEMSVMGLFGVIENAEIKNLAVKVNVKLSDEKDIVLNPLKLGGIVGQAINSKIYNCKVNFELEARRKDYSLTQDAEIDTNSNYFTRSGSAGNYTYTYVSNPILNYIGTYYELLETGENKYNGEVVVGGAVGYGQGLEIYQCAVTTKINIIQEGNNIVNSYFGGVVGQMNGGEIYFVYVAPSESLVSKISARNGSLPALSSGDADILISSSKNNSVIAFGGIIGYNQNSNLVAFNNVYSSLYYTSTPSKLTCGGIIGRINQNISEHPQDLTYSKYLNVPSAFVSSFSGAVGNASAVSYNIHSSNLSFSSMPTTSFYTTNSWKYLKDWDFTNIWKNSSIITYSNYFFPNLQCFASYNIKLSANYTVRYNADGTYSSGYINLYFVDSNGNILWKDFENKTYITEKDFNAGEEVKIRAIFYNDDNSLRDFQHYYNFTNWLVGDTTAISAEGSKVLNGYTCVTETVKNAEDINITQSTITFTASSSKEGIYGIGLIGKSVKVKVHLLVENGTGNETGFGSVDQTIVNNRIVNHTADFEIQIAQYQSGVSTILEAINNANSKYVFANRGWRDAYNIDNNFMTIRKIPFELDNSKTSTLSRFYPTVIYDEEEGLIAEIICYFSNNTSELTLKIKGEGSITIDEGTPITEEHIENIINNKLTTLVANPDEGYKFVGWYMSGILLSTNKTYTTSINEARTIEARFEESELIVGGGLPGWAIAVIVIGSVLIVGIIILIIVKIKKNSIGNYKKNYRY
jgi:uncharacterized protein (UPF0297 family)